MMLLELPLEVQLNIQSHLPLQSLIAARGVCYLWRSLIPGSHIYPARRRLLELYLRSIESSAFVSTRPIILPQLHTFDRQRFLRRLPEVVPDEFYLWVLEWPARAAIGYIWPGRYIPTSRGAHSPENLHKDTGRSMLSANGTHIINSLEFDNPTPGDLATTLISPDKISQCLLLDDAYVDGWQRSRLLVLSAEWGGKDLSGKVYQVDGLVAKVEEPLAHNWVEYLELELRREENFLQSAVA